MEVIEHEHPLKLIDLQLEYKEEEEGDDDDDEEEEEEEDEKEEGGDQTMKEGFYGVTCGRCGEEIHMYHRYYYQCSSCDFSLHKFCAELPSKLEHALHPHPLFLLSKLSHYRCDICKRYLKHGEVCYNCRECYISIDVMCGVQVGKKTIHHPCHQHILTCVVSKPILCECSACGKEHKGMFYQCTTCVGFTIHHDCAFLPKKLLIQQRTDGAFYHTHQLTISYSFPSRDQWDKHSPRCRVCGLSFDERGYFWTYKCDKCWYYVHVDCATSRREPFMSIFLPPRKNIKNFVDADHPGLLHLPFSDETYSMPKHLFFQGTLTSEHKVNLKHMSHEHPLILVQRQSNDSMGQTSSTTDSSLLMYHNPMKKIQLLCNGCIRPIMATMPFYKCSHERCNFAIHEWCTRLPPKIENHPGHPQHALHLMYSNDIPFFFGVFHCKVCRLPCNGFAYCCVDCEYYVDVCCGFIPQKITHEAHPNHLLLLVWNLRVGKFCHMCLRSPNKGQFLFRCNTCDIYVHLKCALFLPKKIRHKYDKHPMQLSYLPIENHKSRYFCEICENDLNPHEAFYHCHDCVQSVHPACAPLTLQSETVTYTRTMEFIYHYLNIKFGGILNGLHQHPLSFAQGIMLDGACGMCHKSLQYGMIFRCLECKFAIHSKCYELLNKI